jgi:hypothetical protein
LERVDPNEISLVVSNWGFLSYDLVTGGAGLEYPKGTGKTAMFASGLWLGAMVQGQQRVAVSEYSSEYLPGAFLFGSPESPDQAALRVYKLQKSYPDSGARDAALNDYNAGAVPRGAPPVHVLADGTLDILGDQMLWAVYNDFDPARHHATPGGTAPLGVEVQQTAYAFDRPGALKKTVLLSLRILNRGGSALQSFYAGMWSDPDLGDFTDDLVGCEPGRSLGYCYNGAGTDAVYGTTPPAIGYDILRATKLQSSTTSTASSFIKYVNGTDPMSASQTYSYLQGLNADGTPIIDPTTNQVTRFMHSGDPTQGTGWLDSQPGDRRFLLTSGPFDLQPGEGVQLDAAIVIGQGTDRLSSITALLHADDEVQSLFDNGFVGCVPVAMGFDFNPNTLNLRSMGRWVTGYLEPPPPFQPADIVVGSVLLNGVVPVDPSAPTAVGDHDGDGRLDLMVKFDRQSVQATLPQGNAVAVQVTGSIGPEGCFAGGTQTRTLHAPITAPDSGATYSPGIVAPVRWLTPAGVSPRWVALLHSLDGGESWTLDTKYLPNYGSASWSVPYAATERARVAVVLVEEQLDESGDVVEGVLGTSPTLRIAGPTGVESGPSELALLGTSPHPARGSMRIDLRLPGSAPAFLSVHDLAGRRLWRREVGTLGAGQHRVLVQSKTLPAGVYLVRLEQRGESRSMRVVLVE